MSTTVLILAYIAIGFLVASIVFRLVPPENSEEAETTVYFLVSIAVWPIVGGFWVALAILCVPIMGIHKWANYLSSFSKS